MKADGPIGEPKTQARVHSSSKGELCLQTSWPPKTQPSVSKGEALLKEILDFIFKDELYQDNCRPDWLENLELDRYYPRLKIAFEYQGFHHSYFVPYYHRTIQDYKDQKKRDRRKRQLCREQKVILVGIFYWHLSVGQVCQLILKVMRKLQRWRQVAETTRIVSSQLSKDTGKEARKAINKRCAAYKKQVKANYDSKKWIKHHKSYAIKHYPRGHIPTRKPKNDRAAVQVRIRTKERDWSREIAQAEKELREAHRDL